jgi:hypothetical protein
VGDDIGAIRTAYEKGEEAKAWALHWSSVYDLVNAQLKAHPTLAAQTITVRYEDLCRTPGETIDRILKHCELDSGAFAAVREGYQSKLAEPTYYQPKYTPDELGQLDEITRATRLAYGYSESAADVLSGVRKAG